MEAVFPQGFTKMSNKALNDTNLSDNACALLAKILSLPDYWRYTIKGLSALSKDGVTAVRNYLQELEDRRYLFRRQTVEANGKFGHNEYVVAKDIYDEGFTQLDNRIVRDKSLPLRAVAVFARMSRLPEQWKFSIKGLTAVCTSGRTAIQTALQKLEQAGYLFREQLRDAKGKICGIAYRLFTQTKQKATQKTKNLLQQVQERITQCNPFLPKQQAVVKVFSKEKVMEQLEYSYLIQQYPCRKYEIIELVNLTVEMLNAKRQTTRIAGSNLPHTLVQERFQQLNPDHILSVLEGLSENTSPVRNTKQYLLACLFNSVSTLNNGLSMEVAHKFT